MAMCGIAGIFAAEADPSEIRAILIRMNEAQRHRGPDEGRIWLDPVMPAGLASRRLAIIDPDHGRQPAVNEDGSIHVVMNGEIYNHADLRSRLLAAGHRFASLCDTEVVVHLYEEYGIQSLEKLKGMFALAVLDTKRERLLLARDGVGMKPLYHCHGKFGVAFSSEPQALFAAGLLPAEPDPQTIDLYFSLGYVPAPLSSFRHIGKLQAGHYLVADKDGIRQGVHWRFRYPSRRSDAGTGQCEEGLERQLREAVRSHLKADAPVGFYLSGGWDSSLVAVLAAQETGERLRTYSLVFPEDPGHDESRYQRLMAKTLGSEHHEVEYRDSGLLSMLLPVARHLGEPCAAMPVMAHYQLAALASRDVRVVLSGEGADELFGGYPWHLPRLPYLLRRLPVRSLFGTIAAITDRIGLRRFCRVVAAADDRAADAEWLRVFDEAEKKALLPPLYRFAGRDLEPVLIPDALQASCRDGIDRRLAQDVLGRLEGAILLAADRLSMAHALEIRMPFLDSDMMAFAAALPSSMKIRGRRQKYLLSRLADRYLPGEIAARRKKGLSQPHGSWVREPIASFVRRFLLDQAASGPFEKRRLERYLAHWLYPGSIKALHIARLVFFQCWWNTHFDKAASQAD